MTKEQDHKFCDKCGKELKIVKLKSINTVTGEHNVTKVCPTRMCGHFGMPKHVNPTPLKNFLGHDYKCLTCGEEYSDHVDIF